MQQVHVHETKHLWPGPGSAHAPRCEEIDKAGIEHVVARHSNSTWYAGSWVDNVQNHISVYERALLDTEAVQV